MSVLLISDTPNGGITGMSMLLMAGQHSLSSNITPGAPQATYATHLPMTRMQLPPTATAQPSLVPSGGQHGNKPVYLPPGGAGFIFPPQDVSTRKPSTTATTLDEQLTQAVLQSFRIEGLIPGQFPLSSQAETRVQPIQAQPTKAESDSNVALLELAKVSHPDTKVQSNLLILNFRHYFASFQGISR